MSELTNPGEIAQNCLEQFEAENADNGNLIMTRRKHEGVVIGRNIRVVVVKIRGDKVRLAIQAPKDSDIRRDELEAWKD